MISGIESPWSGPIIAAVGFVTVNIAALMLAKKPKDGETPKSKCLEITQIIVLVLGLLMLGWGVVLYLDLGKHNKSETGLYYYF